MRFHDILCLVLIGSLHSLFCGLAGAEVATDSILRTFQFRAVELDSADWIHWGDQPGQFSNWTTHSNRLIPVYTWGLNLDSVAGDASPYRDKKQIEKIFGSLPKETMNPEANYFDQTQVYHLQKQAWKSGKKNIILMVFDGMDWQTTQAASIYRNKEVLYKKGRGTGLDFLDYDRANSDFGYCVTSPFSTAARVDVDAQIVTEPRKLSGGYSAQLGGSTPWSAPRDTTYLLGKKRTLKHPFTGSAAAATSLNSGLKTFNTAINVNPDGQQIQTLAHEMQQSGFAIGVVTSMPVCHATPACVYAHNVSRDDYQDLTRDLLGLKSASHRRSPLPGVDVLIGCGWGEISKDNRAKQGQNFIPGNPYIADADLERIDVRNGGKYCVAQRTAEASGKEVLQKAAATAAENKTRLFGFFGCPSSRHLPFQTADGQFDPTRGVTRADKYSPADISENPTLADMTNAALTVLQENENGFYLMVEAGEVDLANHNNNLDDAIGAVLSGDAAFTEITKWVEQHSSWEETTLILTADHGHMMVLDDPSVLTGERQPVADDVFAEMRNAKHERDAEAKRKMDAEAKQKTDAQAKAKKQAAAKKAAAKKEKSKNDKPAA